MFRHLMVRALKEAYTPNEVSDYDVVYNVVKTIVSEYTPSAMVKFSAIDKQHLIECIAKDIIQNKAPLSLENLYKYFNDTAYMGYYVNTLATTAVLNFKLNKKGAFTDEAAKLVNISLAKPDIELALNRANLNYDEVEQEIYKAIYQNIDPTVWDTVGEFQASEDIDTKTHLRAKIKDSIMRAVNMYIASKTKKLNYPEGQGASAFAYKVMTEQKVDAILKKLTKEFGLTPDSIAKIKESLVKTFTEPKFMNMYNISDDVKNKAMVYDTVVQTARGFKPLPKDAVEKKAPEYKGKLIDKLPNDIKAVLDEFKVTKLIDELLLESVEEEADIKKTYTTFVDGFRNDLQSKTRRYEGGVEPGDILKELEAYKFNPTDEGTKIFASHVFKALKVALGSAGVFAKEDLRVKYDNKVKPILEKLGLLSTGVERTDYIPERITMEHGGSDVKTVDSLLEKLGVNKSIIAKFVKIDKKINLPQLYTHINNVLQNNSFYNDIDMNFLKEGSLSADKKLALIESVISGVSDYMKSTTPDKKEAEGKSKATSVDLNTLRTTVLTQATGDSLEKEVFTMSMDTLAGHNPKEFVAFIAGSLPKEIQDLLYMDARNSVINTLVSAGSPTYRDLELKTKSAEATYNRYRENVGYMFGKFLIEQGLPKFAETIDAALGEGTVAKIIEEGKTALKPSEASVQMWLSSMGATTPELTEEQNRMYRIDRTKVQMGVIDVISALIPGSPINEKLRDQTSLAKLYNMTHQEGQLPEKIEKEYKANYKDKVLGVFSGILYSNNSYEPMEYFYKSIIKRVKVNKKEDVFKGKMEISETSDVPKEYGLAINKEKRVFEEGESPEKKRWAPVLNASIRIDSLAGSWTDNFKQAFFTNLGREISSIKLGKDSNLKKEVDVLTKAIANLDSAQEEHYKVIEAYSKLIEEYNASNMHMDVESRKKMTEDEKVFQKAEHIYANDFNKSAANVQNMVFNIFMKQSPELSTALVDKLKDVKSFSAFQDNIYKQIYNNCVPIKVTSSAYSVAASQMMPANYTGSAEQFIEGLAGNKYEVDVTPFMENAVQKLPGGKKKDVKKFKGVPEEAGKAVKEQSEAFNETNARKLFDNYITEIQKVMQSNLLGDSKSPKAGRKYFTDGVASTEAITKALKANEVTPEAIAKWNNTMPFASKSIKIITDILKGNTKEGVSDNVIKNIAASISSKVSGAVSEFTMEAPEEAATPEAKANVADMEKELKGKMKDLKLDDKLKKFIEHNMKTFTEKNKDVAIKDFSDYLDRLAQSLVSKLDKVAPSTDKPNRNKWIADTKKAIEDAFKNIK